LPRLPAGYILVDKEGEVKREELDPRFYADELVVVVSYSVGVIHRTRSSIAAASPTSYFTVHLHIFDSLIYLLGF
jgi:hypothetical protein